MNHLTMDKEVRSLDGNRELSNLPWGKNKNPYETIFIVPISVSMIHISINPTISHPPP